MPPPLAEGAVIAVEVEEAEAADETEDEELVRDIVLRGTRMPRTSSGFIELSAWVEPPHAGREI